MRVVIDRLTWVWRRQNAYIETDSRFGTDVKWSNKGSKGTYDYQGIGAHEFGHSIGLSDLDDSAKLTMHFQGTLGYTGQRTLGRGDSSARAPSTAAETPRSRNVRPPRPIAQRGSEESV